MELLELDTSRGYASVLIEDEVHEIEYTPADLACVCDVGYYKGCDWIAVSVEEYVDRFGWTELITEYIEKTL